VYFEFDIKIKYIHKKPNANIITKKSDKNPKVNILTIVKNENADVVMG
jgi:hypothetical protein